MYSSINVMNRLKTILSRNGISVYQLAKLTKINRSTLQKAFEGSRSLNLRQFNTILNIVTMSTEEKNSLLNEFLKSYWTKDQLDSNNCIIDIFNTISENLNNGNFFGKNLALPPPYNITNSIELIDTISAITKSKLENCNKNNSLNIYTYLPFYTDFFDLTIRRHITGQNVNVSVLIEFIESDEYNTNKNLYILKSIIPLILDTNEQYKLNYVYINGELYNNHLTPYPYYICFDDIVILLDYNLNDMLIIDNQDATNSFIAKHIENTKNTREFNVAKAGIEQCVQYLMGDQILSDTMYAISYEPCITSFVPISMYKELITDEFPNKTEFLNLINERLDNITQTNKKYALFNIDSITDFVETGNLVNFTSPYFKTCNNQQKKIVLNNILMSLDNKRIIMRGFKSSEINVSKNFEITNIQNHYNFSLLVYYETEIAIISIYEPVISKLFIDFIHDILDTHKVLSLEETKQFIQDAIDSL